MRSIRSDRHQISSYHLNKVSLSPFDDNDIFSVMASQVMLTAIKILSNIIMALDQYDVVLDRVIYQDYKFLLKELKKKMKGLNDQKCKCFY